MNGEAPFVIIAASSGAFRERVCVCVCWCGAWRCLVLSRLDEFSRQAERSRETETET